ncbi:MAG: MBL fold metallo-hydrolase [Nanoarchaeota archaeon]
MRVCALASGSAGNCFYIEKGNSAVLVDAGISAKTINERLNAMKLEANKIKGIFVTHEHIDHIRGVDVFARQMEIPIFATKGTIENGFLCSQEELINRIKNNESVDIDGLRIESFLKSHKAAEPISFSVVDKEKNKIASVITDLGYSCKNVNDAISVSDFLFLESNHDIKMLENGPYPYFLKKWVASDNGHLSNKQAALAVLEYSNPKLKNVVLSHLSQKNNLPSVAIKTFRSLMKERNDVNSNISVSLNDIPTKLFSIG